MPRSHIAAAGSSGAPLGAGSRAVLEALAPAGAHPRLPGLLDAGFEAFYAQFRREAAPSLRLAFDASLWTAVWVAPLLIGRRPPITRLDPAARVQALEAFFSHRLYWLRQLGLALKAVASFCYGAHPRVREAMGYPPQFDAPRNERAVASADR